MFQSLVRASALAMCCWLPVVATAQSENAKPSTEQSGDAADTRTLEQKACYLIGYNMGQQLKEQELAVDLEQLTAGLKAALANEKMGMTPEQAQMVMIEFAKKIEGQAAKRMEELAEKNSTEGAAFLKENGAKEGVVTLESGVQYRVMNEGAATASKPTAESVVKVHYLGKTIDGVEFDSSVGGEPVQFPVSGVIRGMTEALQKMKVGDKIELVIPSDLAYGPNGSPPAIGPNAVLIFELELIEIVK